jgi:hypothetical protein
MVNRDVVIRFLLRRPGTLGYGPAGWAATILAAAGAGFMIWSAVLHLRLWADGYKDIPTIGPLFLAQGVASIVLALAIVAVRWLALLAAGAATLVATATGLLISANFGLFGFRESLAVPYATLTLAVEFTGAAILLAGAALLALARPRVRSAPGRPRMPTRT